MTYKRVLFLVHVEPDFENLMNGRFIYETVKAATSGEYDRVIALLANLESGGRGLDACEWIEPGIDEKIEWAWGYEPQQFCRYGYGAEDCECEGCVVDATWVIEAEGSAHEWTLIPEELRGDLLVNASSKIDVIGGCDGECLADFEAVLDYLEYDYSVIAYF